MIETASLLIFLSLILFWVSSRRRRATCIPRGRVIYSDTNRWRQVNKPLYDEKLGLTGKPDYLVRQRGAFIPVEIKSSQISHQPHESHVLQLAAYCLLTMSAFGKRPPHGILHYPNRTFAIDFTVELENTILDILDMMRQDELLESVDRSHDSYERCKHCGYRTSCDQSLM